MRVSRKRRKNNRNKTIIWSIISVVVIACVAIGVIFKDQIITTSQSIYDDFKNKEVEGKVSESKVNSEKEAPIEKNEDTIIEPKEVEKPSVEETSRVNAGGYIENQQPAKEPTYINGILLVNKTNPLPSTYNKGEDLEARAAIDEMTKAAEAKGFKLAAFSGFRSYEYQTTLYNNYVNKDGQEAADRYSARPGYSEHQTGLAFDLGEVGKEELWLTNEFGDTDAGKWLAKNAHNYGFILRYPKGKEEVTGFMHEAWHFRYLGKEVASKVKASGLTLEEYLEKNKE